MTLDTLKASVAWLSTNIDPAVPRALLVVAVLVVVYAVRKLFPRAWEEFARIVPVPRIDPAPVLLVLSKTWQALPGTLIGALTLALSTGGDPRASVKGAVFGALAALAHEIMKAVPWIPYQGKVGGSVPPPGASGNGGGSGGTITKLPTVQIQPWQDSPDEPAELSDLAPKWRHPYLRLALVTAVLLLVACDPRKPPCDESQLRAISKRYIERVTVVCLAKYDRKEDCPEWPALKADHRRELREACPQ